VRWAPAPDGTVVIGASAGAAAAAAAAGPSGAARLVRGDPDADAAHPLCRAPW
jgi:hypothetical protein